MCASIAQFNSNLMTSVLSSFLSVWVTRSFCSFPLLSYLDTLSLLSLFSSITSSIIFYSFVAVACFIVTIQTLDRCKWRRQKRTRTRTSKRIFYWPRWMPLMDAVKRWGPRRQHHHHHNHHHSFTFSFAFVVDQFQCHSHSDWLLMLRHNTVIVSLSLLNVNSVEHVRVCQSTSFIIIGLPLPF